MKIYEYGEENPECILLIHPSLVTWDYFENVIPLLEEHYHLLIPAIPGYDLKDDSQFSTVEKVASQLADELLQKGIREVKAIYGCSMGGSIVLRMAADGKLKAQHYVMDGGITPYQLPWILTRLIALRDFGMMALGKLGGERLIVKAFSSSQYSEEDLKYVANIFRHCTYKTLWNTSRGGQYAFNGISGNCFLRGDGIDADLSRGVYSGQQVFLFCSKGSERSADPERS